MTQCHDDHRGRAECPGGRHGDSALHQERDSQQFSTPTCDVYDAGEVGVEARRAVEARLGHAIVSSTNVRQVRHARRRHRPPPLFPDADTDASDAEARDE